MEKKTLEYIGLQYIYFTTEANILYVWILYAFLLQNVYWLLCVFWFPFNKKKLGLPELEMKGDNMEIYCVCRIAREEGNLTMPEFMRPDKAWLPTRNFSFSCLGDKLHHHFQGPFAIEKQINPVIFKLYLWGFMKTHPIWLCFGPEALASWFFTDYTNSSCYLILKEVLLFLQVWSP